MFSLPGPLCMPYLSILGGALTLLTRGYRFCVDPTEGGRAPAELPEALCYHSQFLSTTKLSVAIPIPKEGLSTALSSQEIVWKE